MLAGRLQANYCNWITCQELLSGAGTGSCAQLLPESLLHLFPGKRQSTPATINFLPASFYKNFYQQTSLARHHPSKKQQLES